MRKNQFTLFASLIIVLVISSCARDINFHKREQAQNALEVFFVYLSIGDYMTAAAFFSGSYETLIEFNPDLDPDDHAALWLRGCQINGLQCLRVRTARFVRVADSGEFIFAVEFSNSDDSLFVLDACCGKGTANKIKSQFEYRVQECEDGEFRVLDFPIYVP